ncbi:MAG: hypothetical protein ACI9Y7_002679 [Dokdonia sp.]|jgi:hypothetical protein
MNYTHLLFLKLFKNKKNLYHSLLFLTFMLSFLQGFSVNENFKIEKEVFNVTNNNSEDLLNSARHRANELKTNLFNSSVIAGLKGKVIDEFGDPIELVAVSLYKTVDSTFVRGVITDQFGVFNLEDINSGDYYIRTSALGFNETYSDVIKIDSDEIIDLDPIVLTTSITALEGVLIVVDNSVVERKSDRFIVKVKESALVVGTSIDLLRTTPFISISGSNQISLQGKSTLVLLDNKPIPDSSVESILQMIPAGNISSIELITNPSAKYDAIYGAVINIITKSGQSDGYTGNVSLVGAYGRLGAFSVNTSLNYKKGALTTFGSLGYIKNDQFSYNNTKRVLDNANVSNVNEEEIDRFFNQNFYSVQAGMEYEINENQKIGALVTTNPVRRTGDFNSVNKFRLLNAAVDSVLVTKSPFKSKGATNNYNINYNLLADSTRTELSVLGTYTSFRNDLEQFFTSEVLDDGGATLRVPGPFQTANITDIDVWIAQVDFVRNLNNEWKLETGIRNQITNSDSNITYNEENNNGALVVVPEFSNDIELKETISAAYAIVSKNWAKDQIQLGLRLENTKSSFTGAASQENLKLFPSLFYQHDINKKYNFSLSYRRTIRRAPYNELVPYTIFVNNFTVFTGNPSLQPQFDDIISLDVNLNKLNLSLSYTNIDGMFGQFPISQDFDTGVTFFSLQNLDRSKDIILNAYFPLKITSWWKTRNSGAIFGYSKSTGEVLGNEFSLSSSWFNFRSNHTITFSKSVELELVGDYSSDLTSELTRIGAVGNVNASLLIKVLKNQGQITIGAYEIIQRNVFTSDQFFSNYSSEKFRFRDSRRVRVGFTYNFGKLDNRTPSKKLGNDDAINRIQ